MIISFGGKGNPDLDNYATQKALEGLFHQVAQEEKRNKETSRCQNYRTTRKAFVQQYEASLQL